MAFLGLRFRKHRRHIGCLMIFPLFAGQRRLMIQIICALKILAIDLLSKRLVLILDGRVLVPYITSFHLVQQLLLVLRRISVVFILVFLEAVAIHGLGRWIQATRLLKGIEFISLRLNR